MSLNVVNSIKKILKNFIIELDILKRPSIRYCVDNKLFPSIVVWTPSNTLREMLNLPSSKHQTQLNQDVFALLINQFKSGFFLEIGANDGFTLSNTIYLEEHFGWQGVLVEANNKYMTSLEKRTNSIIVNKAVSSHKGTVEFVDAGLYGGIATDLDDSHSIHTTGANKISVDCTTVQDILDQASAPRQVDFISIDVEGGELPIVEQVVAADRRFRCGCIEYNDRMSDYKRMTQLLESSDYKILWENQTGQDLFFIDSRISNI